MTTTQQAQGASASDRLKDALQAFLRGQADQLASKARGRLSQVVGQVAESAEQDGALPKMGARVLKGEPPVSSEDAKQSVLSRLHGGSPSGGDGGGDGEQAEDVAKATYVTEVLDIGVPVRTAYDHWTQYDEFSAFTKGVREVSKEDEVTSQWSVKVGPTTRQWKATVLEQIPDDRIVWRTEGGEGSTQGAVSFHELAPTLTRVLLVVQYQPSGFLEKTGNLWRAQGRRMRLDFKNFQGHVTFAGGEPEGWRGEIRDGEVTMTHEEATRREAEEDGHDGDADTGDGDGE